MKYRPVMWRVGERTDYNVAIDIIYIEERRDLPGMESGDSKFAVLWGIWLFDKAEKWARGALRNEGTLKYIERTHYDSFEDAAKAADKAYELYVKQGDHL